MSFIFKKLLISTEPGKLKCQLQEISNIVPKPKVKELIFFIRIPQRQMAGSLDQNNRYILPATLLHP